MASNEPHDTELRLEKFTWTITDVIGRGGGGVVRAATSPLIPDAAAKFIPLEPAMPRELIFDYGPQNVRNVVPIVDHGQTESDWVIVMPRAETSLDKVLLALTKPMPLDDSLTILRDLAVTLDDLNARVVHRDVKPANMLRLGGAWHLGDFGIARYHDVRTATHTKKSAFSREYAAPERWRSERATSATDIYSWGVIAFELCTGELPFLGETREELRYQHLHDPPPAISGIPDALASLIEECLYKDPASRPTSSELLRRLSDVQIQKKPGIEHLHRVQLAWTRARAGQQTDKSARKSEKERKQHLHRDAMTFFRRLSNTLWDALSRGGGTPDDSYDDSLGWRLTLGQAKLTLTRVRSSGRQAFAAVPSSLPQVAAYATIDLTVSDPAATYGGRAHSLWFTNAKRTDIYRWHELAFMHAGYPHRTSSYMPFALGPDQQTRRALANVSDRFVLYGEPFVMSSETLPDFIDRWALWFAQGADGSLSF